MLQSKLHLLVIILLLFCRVDAIVHAAEHSFEHDHSYCEVCSLCDQQSSLTTSNKVTIGYQSNQSITLRKENFDLSLQNNWQALSRAPPFSL